jgi:hypothetical protein
VTLFTEDAFCLESTHGGSPNQRVKAVRRSASSSEK